MRVGEASRLAVLIDADNASAAVARELLEEVAKYGTATVKRAYGDWTTQNLVGWKDQPYQRRQSAERDTRTSGLSKRSEADIATSAQVWTG